MAVNKVEYAGNTLIDLTGDTVSADKLLSGITAHAASGEAISGSMADKGAVSGTISTKAGVYTIPEGYHNGSGKVQISSTEQAKIIAANIRSGIKLLGVTGTLAEGAKIKVGSFSGNTATTSYTVTHGLGATPNIVILWRETHINSYTNLAVSYLIETTLDSPTSQFIYCNGGSSTYARFAAANSGITLDSSTVTLAGTSPTTGDAVRFNGTYNYLIGVI